MWQADAHSLPGSLPALESCTEGWRSLQVLKRDKIPQSVSPRQQGGLSLVQIGFWSWVRPLQTTPWGIETTVRTRAAPTFPNPTGASRPKPTGAGLAQGPFFKPTWRFFPPFL